MEEECCCTLIQCSAMAGDRLARVPPLLFLISIIISVFTFPVTCKQLKCASEHLKSPKSVSSLGGKSSSSSVCQTAACAAVGKSLHQAIDWCADPCEDFYAFSCGNWAALHPLSPENSSTSVFGGSSTFTLMSNKVDSLLKKLLLSNSTAKSKSRAVALAKDFYRECLDLEARNQIGLEPLQRAFADTVGGYQWPIRGEQAKLLDEATIDYKEALMKALIRFIAIEKSPILDLFIDTDINDTAQTVFYLGVPDGFDKDKVIYANEGRYESLISYYVGEMVTLTEGVVGSSPEDNDTAVFEVTSSVWELELELVNASTSAEVLANDPKEGYNKMSLKELEEQTGSEFSWSSLLKFFVEQFNLQMEISESTQLIVGDLNYFRKLPAILAKTPLHVIYNYLGMSLFYAYRPQNDTTIDEQCLALVTAKFDQAVSRLYVDEHEEEQAKQQQKANNLVAETRASFRRLVEREAKWLDEATKTRVLQKEAATQFESLFPGWLLDDRRLDEHYGLAESNFSVKAGHFLESMLALRRHRMVTFSRQMGYTIKENKLGAANVNAHANKFANQVYLPAAIFQRPLFDADLPPTAAYLNLASLGFIVGHELVHNFDSDGRYFDATGHLLLPHDDLGKPEPESSWWSKSSSDYFDRGEHCLAAQYGSLIEEVSGLLLKGNFTLAENIADQGGLRIAYEAAFRGTGNLTPRQARRGRRRHPKHQLLPKMEAFTPEQLFFVRFASTWCAHYDNSSLALAVDTDDHSPERFRVNLPLANFAPFSAAFGCQRGTGMNPTEKCVLW